MAKYPKVESVSKCSDCPAIYSPSEAELECELSEVKPTRQGPPPRDCPLREQPVTIRLDAKVLKRWVDGDGLLTGRFKGMNRLDLLDWGRRLIEQIVEKAGDSRELAEVQRLKKDLDENAEALNEFDKTHEVWLDKMFPKVRE